MSLGWPSAARVAALAGLAALLMGLVWFTGPMVQIHHVVPLADPAIRIVLMAVVGIITFVFPRVVSAFTVGLLAIIGVLAAFRLFQTGWGPISLLGPLVAAWALAWHLERTVQRRTVVYVLYGAVILCALGIAGAVLYEYRQLQNIARLLEDATSSYQDQFRNIPGKQVSDTRFPDILPPLDVLEGAADEAEGLARGAPFNFLDRSDVAAAGRDTYHRALKTTLLPRLVLRTEDLIQSWMEDPVLLSEALLVYLMLLNPELLNPEIVSTWTATDFEFLFPGEQNYNVRRRLDRHVSNLLKRPLANVSGSESLINEARGRILEIPISKHIYDKIISSHEARDLPPWRPDNAGGPDASRVFLRASGQPLSQGIDGIYTRDGFYSVFRPAALSAADLVLQTQTILGRDFRESPTELIISELFDLYYAEYVRAYDDILADLEIVPTNSVAQAISVTKILSAPNSPMLEILRSIAAQTNLTQEANEGSTMTSDGRLSRLVRSRLASILGPREDLPGTSGEFVADHFDWMNVLIGSKPGLPALAENVAADIADVYAALRAFTDRSTSGGNALDLTDSIARLEYDTGSVGDPISRWTDQLRAGLSDVSSGQRQDQASIRPADTSSSQSQAQLNALWQSEVFPFCRAHSEGRYPFSRAASASMSLRDFSRLFAPDGLIDSYVSKNLLRFIDTSTRPWSWAEGSGRDLGIADDALRSFERAAEIRDAFFATGEFGLVLLVSPESLDPTAAQAVLEIDGQSIRYSHGPVRPFSVRWPGDVGLARLRIVPLDKGASSVITEEGPWALLRLMDRGSLNATANGERRLLSFDLQGKKVTFELTWPSAITQQGFDALSTFQCPADLFVD